MFFFPYNTDAPIYHYPIGTAALIAANVLVFFLVLGGQIDPQTAESLVLHFGEVRPLEWLTTNFMHADIWHLLGNMFFLWGFGLVVEGKLGWYRFVPIYLLIAVLYGGLVQAIMFGSTGGALGASGVIFGLIGLAIVWAPKNDIHCLFVLILFFIRVYTFSMTIVNFGGLYLGLQVVSFWLDSFSMSSAALHLAGFAVGFPIGLLFLKLDWVDCEGWDLINVWTGQHRKDAIALREEAESVAEDVAATKAARAEQDRATALQLIRAHLQDGHPEVAYAIYQKSSGADGELWQLPRPELLALVGGLQQQKKWSESVPLMVDLAKRFPEQAAPVRLKLAQILVQAEERPQQALAVLAKLPEQLPSQLAQRRQQIEQLAQAAIEDGAVEYQINDW